MSTAALAAPSASGILYECARICELLHLPPPEGSEPEAKPPHPGKFRFWTPSWNLIEILNCMHESGLVFRESMHVRSKPFARPALASGYLTVPFTSPKCANDKFRKPGQLKASEQLAPLASVMMAVLVRYLGDLDLLYTKHWLITSDKVADKTVCLYVGDEALLIDLHDDRQLSHSDHGCAVLIS